MFFYTVNICDILVVQMELENIPNQKSAFLNCFYAPIDAKMEQEKIKKQVTVKWLLHIDADAITAPEKIKKQATVSPNLNRPNR